MDDLTLAELSTTQAELLLGDFILADCLFLYCREHRDHHVLHFHNILIKVQSPYTCVPSRDTYTTALPPTKKERHLLQHVSTIIVYA